MSEKCLDNNCQNLLRQSGKLDKNEIAYQVGDLMIAVNVINQTRRLLEKDSILEVLNNNIAGNKHKTRNILKG
jgi:hypothetical protein